MLEDDRYREKILNDGLVLAQESPCLRRKYCAQITIGKSYVVGWHGVNARFSDCCNDKCIRETTNAKHGQMVERGGEAHAETMAIMKFPYVLFKDQGCEFYLSGVETSTGAELIGPDAFCCHTCALMVKAAGFENVTLRFSDGFPVRMPIDDIIRYREKEWN